MARRHDVQNLLRRGNIWYWRPRLPAALSQSDLNRKLSFSLRQSDHHRARFMARRLNTRLAEMRFRRDLGTTRQDGLRALFEAEIDRMNEMMDDLVTAAKATGSHADPVHLEADNTPKDQSGDAPLSRHDFKLPDFMTRGAVKVATSTADNEDAA